MSPRVDRLCAVTISDNAAAHAAAHVAAYATAYATATVSASATAAANYSTRRFQTTVRRPSVEGWTDDLRFRHW